MPGPLFYPLAIRLAGYTPGTPQKPAFVFDLTGARVSGGSLNGHIRQGQNGNVVFLAKLLRGCGECGGRYTFAQHIGDAVEAEELALGVLGFGHAIGHED